MATETNYEAEALTGGEAFHALLSEVNIDAQLAALKKEVLDVKSPTKRNAMVKQIKYLGALKANGQRPEEVFTLKYVPIIPPVARPSIQQAGNRMEFADVNKLYQEHMLVNNTFKDLRDSLPDDMLVEQRRALHDGAKAVFGVGEALKGSSRAEGLKGFLKQIGGEGGPKTGFFQDKLLKRKQDFSGRATIAGEPNLGFNEMGVPEDMLWAMMNYHIVRDLVQNGYTYSEAKKAAEARTPAAKSAFTKVIKRVPIIANRAPTLFQSNITAHMAVPVAGKTLRVNPLHLPMYAGDFDGDAFSVYVPQTPEAVEEAKQKLLPSSHIYDFRKGVGNSMVAPGHEAIVGSVYLTEPDVAQKPVHFKTEGDALAALKAGTIKANTPIVLG